MSVTDEPVIRVRGLRMAYGDAVVLDGVDFDVERGEVVCLLGPNGAGKTTTVEVLEGFRARSAGLVEVFGEDPQHAGDRWRARTGVVLQTWRDHARWTPRRLLTELGGYYAPYLAGRDATPWAIEELLELVGLTAIADRRVATFSGGQRRRLDVAIGIVGRPELLFLDEPTAGFDPEARRDFHDLVHRLADLDHTTVVLTTHDLAEAEKLASRVLVLGGGLLVADDSVDALARRFAGEAQVTWTSRGERFVHSAAEPHAFLRELLARPDEDVADLEVRRADLEGAYLQLVRELETGGADTHGSGGAARAFAAVAR